MGTIQLRQSLPHRPGDGGGVPGRGPDVLVHAHHLSGAMLAALMALMIMAGGCLHPLPGLLLQQLHIPVIAV